MAWRGAAVSKYREEPFGLSEQFFWEAVKAGSCAMNPRCEEKLIQWKGPTEEPFLTMWANGERKFQAVHRLPDGRSMTIHFWMHPQVGHRHHLKFTSHPIRSNPGPDRTLRQAERILAADPALGEEFYRAVGIMPIFPRHRPRFARMVSAAEDHATCLEFDAEDVEYHGAEDARRMQERAGQLPLDTAWARKWMDRYPRPEWYKPRRKRKNPDVRMRELERQAALGDPHAIEALAAARARLEPHPDQKRLFNLLADLETFAAGASPALEDAWPEVMRQLVEAAVDWFGRTNHMALDNFFFKTGHPGLDWVYRRRLSPWSVDQLYNEAIYEAVNDAGIETHRINGTNASILLPRRGHEYVISLDVYVDADEEEDAENLAYRLDPRLEDVDRDLIHRHAQGISDNMWDIDLVANEFMEDSETYDVQIDMRSDFGLYHLLAMLDMDIDFEPPRRRKKKKVRAGKKKKKKKKKKAVRKKKKVRRRQ
jgi:hypothetical protein